MSENATLADLFPVQHTQSLSQEKLVDGMLPDFRDMRKKEFLVLRSSNFSVSEALAMCGATGQEYNLWKSNDKVFEDWAINHIWHLQNHIGHEVLLARFKRNVFLQMSIDTEVLAKRAYDPENLTDDERQDARAAANRYNAQSIAAIFKVLDPAVGQDMPQQAPVQVNLNVDVGLADIDQYTRRKTQAQQLLQQFRNKEPSGHTVIDGVSGEIVADD